MPDRVNSQSPSEITAEHLNGGARPVMMTDHRDNRRGREDAIGETKSHDVLDCVLAEKVVDPEHLILVQRNGFSITTRRQNRRPPFWSSIGELGFAQLLHDGTE